jgi:hypothetical protein
MCLLTITRLSEGIETITKKVTHVNDTIEKMSDNIKETAKKYSTYLHDEHTQIYEALPKQNWQAGGLPKSVSLLPSPRLSETSPRTTLAKPVPSLPFQASRSGVQPRASAGVLPPPLFQAKGQGNMLDSKFFPKTTPSDFVSLLQTGKAAKKLGARANTRLALTPIYIPK